ncbi:thioredoxin [Coccomyxa subellipsoidea C-169]|uniref:Thioredoxin n=1 Tax=Coccomyxa subellipsoidea (strain C-169) TaxID=574566 RepID=I0Z636_COCSC|nr:thioredoxin [Coccomyxa subellipsoidea C-169]EIE26105.1 thioredoxin [Coccomyxa subellipsoidea C-169]|eukprot:XP_005650649.1 thioredoxin [Coccomyxa subellipsoidea C-169]
MGGGNVHVVETELEWNQKLKEAGSKPVIVDFTATWCGPCRIIAPVFEQLSTKYPSVVFLKVDVDKNEAVAAACGISAMPTFQVFKDGKKIHEMVGASADNLEQLVEQLSKS